MSNVQDVRRSQMDNDKKPLKDAIEFQLGMIGLARATDREDLFQRCHKNLDTLLQQIPGDLFVKD